MTNANTEKNTKANKYADTQITHRYGYGTKVDGPHGSSTVYVHGFGTDDSYQPAPAHG